MGLTSEQSGVTLVTMDTNLVDELRGEIEKLLRTQAVCHCGDLVKDHTMYAGHSSVEMIEGPCPDAAEQLDALIAKRELDVKAMREGVSALWGIVSKAGRTDALFHTLREKDAVRARASLDALRVRLEV